MRTFSHFLFKVTSVPQTRPEIFGFGDNVVDCYADLSAMFPGGNALNVAVFAQRFGARSGYGGAVADDPAGRLIRRALVAEEVDISRLRIVPGRTAYCVIDTRDGEREFVCADLGVSIVAPGQADLARMAEADAVHTGRSSHLDSWLGQIASLTRLSYDFATLHDPVRIATLAPHCYLASFSGGGLGVEAAAHLAKQASEAGAVWALVTRGKDGAILNGPDGMVAVPARPIVPLDTLGAGDTFIARTLVGLLRSEPVPRILSQAGQEAATTCGEHGAFGHNAPIQIDRAEAKTMDELYRTTSPAPAPIE